MRHTVEGGITVRPYTDAGPNEATEAWALIGIASVLWWTLRHATRLARKAAR